MGKDFYESSALVRDLFALASDSSGIDVRKLLFEGTEEDLRSTNNTQIAMTTVSLSAALNAREHGIEGVACAGFSLGEWAALGESGVLPLEEVFRLVKLRGSLMDEALKKLPPSGMSAVLFLPTAKVEEAIAASGLKNVFVANYNSPTQTVISGLESELGKAEELLLAAGAKKAVRLKVAGAFHVPLLAEARAAFAEALAKAPFKDPAKRLYSNVTAGRVLSGEEARKLAAEQVVSPVRWIEEEAAIVSDGVGRCLEMGPGTVLANLWKAVNKDIPCLPMGTLDQIVAISI
jgi:[acyl-carrier-protein] S-malonyltransferase